MLRFMDGFDYYATADLPLKWNAVNTNFSQPQVSPSGRYGTGSQSLSNGDPQGYVTRTLPAQSAYIIGMAIKITAVASASNNTTGSPFIILTDAGATQVDLRINMNGNLVVTRNGTVLATGTTQLINATWYYVEFMATIGSSVAANSCIVRIGGTNEIVLPAGANTQSTGNASINGLKLLGLSGGALIDDLYVCDTTGTTNNTFLGDVRVECLRPAANGTVAGFSPGTGSNYSNVNQATEDGDTTYNASATIGAEDTFTFGALSNNAGAIFGLQTTMMARKDDAGGRSLAAVVRHSGTDYPGSTVGLPDSYVYFSEARETNPATGVAWTNADVNSIEAGYKLME